MSQEQPQIPYAKMYLKQPIQLVSLIPYVAKLPNVQSVTNQAREQLYG